ncbi:hypothetical protein ACHAXM_001311 [Skeletonema potamos]
MNGVIIVATSLSAAVQMMSTTNSPRHYQFSSLSHKQQNSSSAASPPRYESLSQFLLSSLGSDSLILSQSFVLSVDEGDNNNDDPIHPVALSMEEGSYSSALAATLLSSSTHHKRQLFLTGRYDSPCAIFLGFVGIALLGIILAFIFPSSGGQQQHQHPISWDFLSNILGYTYFLSWTLSFYPQIITNWKHPDKAVKGLSLDFILWNIIGFALYVIYTTSLRYSAVVRQEYADRFGGGENATILFTAIDNNNNNNSTGENNAVPVAVPQVKTNDVAFAWHALILTIITFIQIICNEKKYNRKEELTELASSMNHNDSWRIYNVEQEGMRLEDSLGDDSFVLNEDDFGQQQQQQQRRQQKQDTEDHPYSSQTTHFTESHNQRMKQTHKRWTKRISYTTKILIGALTLTCIGFGSTIAANVGQSNLLDFLYFLSYVKVGITTVKYIPQVMLNYRRKSTAGWAIWNILLDFTGGSLSIIQLIGDSLAQDGSWTGVIGNPAKLGLGLVSICFDVIFIVQHYVLYRNPPPVSMLPWNDHGGIDTTKSDHDTPLLASIHGLL